MGITDQGILDIIKKIQEDSRFKGIESRFRQYNEIKVKLLHRKRELMKGRADFSVIVEDFSKCSLLLVAQIEDYEKTLLSKEKYIKKAFGGWWRVLPGSKMELKKVDELFDLFKLIHKTLYEEYKLLSDTSKDYSSFEKVEKCLDDFLLLFSEERRCYKKMDVLVPEVFEEMKNQLENTKGARQMNIVLVLVQLGGLLGFVLSRLNGIEDKDFLHYLIVVLGIIGPYVKVKEELALRNKILDGFE